MFAGSFNPVGWEFCRGQLLPISEHDALFILIGTTYGGDGESNFALPNFQSRIPIHQGTGLGLSSRLIGGMGGAESVTLSTQQIPVHNHAFLVSTESGNLNTPIGSALGTGSPVGLYRPGVAASPMAAQSISPVGGSQPHDNMVPYQVMSYIISLYGDFPQFN
jgi:microcystin-dependent protein